jgi:hypothetical protein
LLCGSSLALSWEQQQQTLKQLCDAKSSYQQRYRKLYSKCDDVAGVCSYLLIVQHLSQQGCLLQKLTYVRLLK